MGAALAKSFASTSLKDTSIGTSERLGLNAGNFSIFLRLVLAITGDSLGDFGVSLGFLKGFLADGY